MKIDKYLYEIIDDYKDANSEEERLKVFNDFCSSIWSNQNKRRIYVKTIRYIVLNDLLESEIGRIFNTWSNVCYISYKTMTKETDWCSLIRQKINNLYTRYCDKDVVLNANYIELLKTPKKLYYRWINGEKMNAEKLTDDIENSIYQASELKTVFQKQKMNLTWDEYKEVIEYFLQKIFNNCETIEDYEMKNSTNNIIYDFYNEDNSYVKYICNSLECYMLNYQKEYYGLKRGRNKSYNRCKECGKLIEKNGNKKTYCNDCAKKRKQESNRQSDRRYKNKKRENRNLLKQP